MRCYVCNKDAPDGEIRLERHGGRVKFSPCSECQNVIQRTVLLKELEDEEAPTLPLWDIE
jgi:hypothetical protein